MTSRRFPIGGRVKISPSTENLKGDVLPQAGLEGVVVAKPDPRRLKYLVEVPGLPLALVRGVDLELIRKKKVPTPKKVKPAYWRPSMGEARRPDLSGSAPVLVGPPSANDRVRPKRPSDERWMADQHHPMLRAPRRLPPFALLMQDMGDMMISERRLAKYLDVHRDTIRRWRVTGNIPRTALLCLFWESQWGRNLADTAAMNDARLYYGYTQALKKEVARLCVEIDALSGEIQALKAGKTGSANSPVYRKAAA